jgi:hypothetical protein
MPASKDAKEPEITRSALEVCIQFADWIILLLLLKQFVNGYLLPKSI